MDFWENSFRIWTVGLSETGWVSGASRPRSMPKLLIATFHLLSRFKNQHLPRLCPITSQYVFCCWGRFFFIWLLFRRCRFSFAFYTHTHMIQTAIVDLKIVITGVHNRLVIPTSVRRRSNSKLATRESHTTVRRYACGPWEKPATGASHFTRIYKGVLCQLNS